MADYLMGRRRHHKGVWCSKMSFEEQLLERQICLKSADLTGDSAAPVAVHPTPFSRVAFNHAIQLQSDFNLLVLRTAQNGPLLHQICEKLANSDDFVRNLFNVYKKHPNIPKLFFTVNRSDYMVEGDRIFQIELNTISASMAGLSTKFAELQRQTFPTADIPDNRACYDIADSFACAIAVYREEYSIPSAKPVAILFVVQENERNIYDQLHIQNNINPSIPIIRKSLNCSFQVEAEGILSVDGMECGLVYYRSGYAPQDYKSESCWHNRQLLESSRAIKCPDIASHLAGLKKVQQVLADPQQLLQTCQQDSDLCARLKASFAGIYSLDANEEGRLNAQMAINHADPNKFVMKPQREGGGNNIYGLQIKEALLKLSETERAAFILMDRIHPSLTPSTQILRFSKSAVIDAVSELGIYGCLLANRGEIVLNRTCGWLLRTKPIESDEGGVISGYSVIDVPSLKQ